MANLKIPLDKWLTATDEDRYVWLVLGAEVGAGAEILGWASIFTSAGATISDEVMLKVFRDLNKEKTSD